MNIQVNIPFQLAMQKMGTYYAVSVRETDYHTKDIHAKGAATYNSQKVGTRDHQLYFTTKYLVE